MVEFKIYPKTVGRILAISSSGIFSISGRHLTFLTVILLLTVGGGLDSPSNLAQILAVESASRETSSAVGARGQVGCDQNPKSVQRLIITELGVYENFLVDGNWINSNLVKINADGVTLRHCEIRNGQHNGVTVYARDVVIESCKIHHLLKGTFAVPEDAHGITGRPTNLVIRNCEIFLVTGDAVQFDPDRGPWDNVLIENCTFWTAPLASDAAGFKRGERPGENAVDTKQYQVNPRSRLIIRDSLFLGWGEGYIQNQAALNLKENVEVTVEGCVFRDNDICFRLRGGSGERGGALVTIQDCAVYQSKIAIRMEDNIRDLKIYRLGFGEGIGRKYTIAGGVGPGYENQGEYVAPPYEQAMKEGVRR